MFRVLLSIFICLMVSLNSSASQSRGHFYITGSIKVEQGLVEGTNIQIFRNGALLNTVAVNRTGNFRIKVDLDQVYRFQFNKELFYSKLVEIDTHVPASVCEVDCVFPPYQVAILLYRKVPGVNEMGGDVPRISYNPKIDNFDAEMMRDEASISDQIGKIMTDIKQQSERYERESAKTKSENYQKALAEADQLKRRQEYDKAMHRYRDALLIFPEQRNPRDQVNAMYHLLIAQQLTDALGAAVEENLLKYINYGDLKIRENEFTMAKIAYEIALRIKPDDSAIRTKLNNAQKEVDNIQKLALAEVDHFQNVYKARTLRYQELIKQGDQMFRQEKLADAKNFYAQAATQINERSYAVLMVNKIEELLNDNELALKLAKEKEEADKKRLLEARNRAFADAVAEADRMFAERMYRDAVEYYELALTIKEFELYPRNQIRIIREILANLQLKGEEYNGLLREADALMLERKYKEARPVYQKAHSLIPEEKYALKKIEEIDRLLVGGDREAELQKAYDDLILVADALLLQQNYDSAISKYQEALSMKPNEKYPADQIRKIREILSRESSEQKRLAQQRSDYDRSILMADRAFNQESYQPARSLYHDALRIFPGQEYPQNQISKIDAILKERVAVEVQTVKLDQIDFSNLQNLSGEAREAAYKEAMELGASFMKTEEWGIARFYFRRALALIPNDEPATKKIDEVERIIRGSNSNEAKYAEMIQRADEAFKTGDFGVAQFYYTKAKEAKPTDPYVNERIQVVTQLSESTASRMANREYDTSMQRANEALEVKNYAVARFFYRKALSQKPNDELAKKKIEEVELLIKQ